MRLVDRLKSAQITVLFTTLTRGEMAIERTEVGISSLIDTWIQLRNLEKDGQRTRLLYILKSRGMANSNRVREFLLTDQGVDLMDVYVGPDGILTGNSRVLQVAMDKSVLETHQREVERQSILTEQKRRVLEARIMQLQCEFESERVAAESALHEAGVASQLIAAKRGDIGDAGHMADTPLSDQVAARWVSKPGRS
jgi:circadian clock protein KaiC